MPNAKFEAVRLELTTARHRMDAVRQDIAGRRETYLVIMFRYVVQ